MVLLFMEYLFLILIKILEFLLSIEFSSWYCKVLRSIKVDVNVDAMT